LANKNATAADGKKAATPTSTSKQDINKYSHQFWEPLAIELQRQQRRSVNQLATLMLTSWFFSFC